MRRTAILGTLSVALLGWLFSGDAAARAAGPDDDLQVVKRAVRDGQTASASKAPADARAEGPADRPLPRKAGAEPQWLRVRITEKGGKRVRVNLPLSLVRSVSDWPIEIGCHAGREDGRTCSTLRFSEVLAALDKGESLVEIDDNGTRVRVWVE